jgi:hypothetical protein
MKLTKKHIGQLFDCRGGDGSWVYQLVDINPKTKEILFYSLSSGDFWVFKDEYTDWRPFETREWFTKKQAWADARRENF